MSASMSLVRKLREQRLMGVPSLPIRNFSKFQAMSVLLTGFQIKKWGLAIRLSESSEGAGSDFLRNVKRGCSFSPFTSTLSNMSPLNSKPLPGLTCFSRLTISSPPPFSCSASTSIKLIVNQSRCGQQPSEQNNVAELVPKLIGGEGEDGQVVR